MNHYDANVQIRADYCIIDVRLDSAKHSFLADALDMKSPAMLNQYSRTASQTLLQIGPDQFIILASFHEQARILDKLGNALAGQHCAITDVSDHYAVFELTGSHSDDVLAQGCSSDLHDFLTNHCTRTHKGAAFKSVPCLMNK